MTIRNRKFLRQFKIYRQTVRVTDGTRQVWDMWVSLDLVQDSLASTSACSFERMVRDWAEVGPWWD